MIEVELYDASALCGAANRQARRVYKIHYASGATWPERGEMGLRLCDCRSERARLCLAQGDPTLAREHWATAKEMVERTGYHRRDREVAGIAWDLGERA